jgi:ABC-type dipeptide/oligopeptide/nickel transport system permease subunit
MKRSLLFALVGLCGLSLCSLVGGALRPHASGAKWPSLGHPLGLDSLGRDFLHVLADGTLDFSLPGAAAVLTLVAAIALQGLWTATRSPLSGRPRKGLSEAWLVLAAPPRLLLVMIAMLFLDEPSPWVAAGIVTFLYLPVALDECASVLQGLREEQVLAGAIAHGLSASRLVLRHLLGGHLRPVLGRHAAALFCQVAFTQLALSYVFGSSAVTSGLSVSWGMEFRRLVARLPARSGSGCLPDVVCEPNVALFHCSLLILTGLLLLGGLLRGSGPAGARSPS